MRDEQRSFQLRLDVSNDGHRVWSHFGLSMNEREQLIERLVTTMHLSVSERAALSTDTVRYSEVAKAVARVLEDTGYFPPNARPWREGNIVHEGAILQKLSGGGFRLTLQRSHPVAPAILAEKRESDFQNAKTAIKAFISSEWPKGIDGIAIKRLGFFR